VRHPFTHGATPSLGLARFTRTRRTIDVSLSFCAPLSSSAPPEATPAPSCTCVCLPQIVTPFRTAMCRPLHGHCSSPCHLSHARRPSHLAKSNRAKALRCIFSFLLLVFFLGLLAFAAPPSTPWSLAARIAYTGPPTCHKHSPAHHRTPYMGLHATITVRKSTNFRCTCARSRAPLAYPLRARSWASLSGSHALIRACCHPPCARFHCSLGASR
jgi:hypothetical protein